MIPKSELPYIEWTNENGTTERLYAGIIQSEQLQLASIVTEFPVETGGRIADNVRPDNKAMSVRMVFSATPIRGDLTIAGSKSQLDLDIPDPPKRSLLTPGGLTSAAISVVENAFGGTPATPSGVEALQFPEEINIHRFIGDTFRRLVDTSTLITISGRLTVLENMAILTAVLDDAEDEGEEVAVSLTVREIRFVSSDVTLALPITPRAQRPKDGGAKGKETVDPAKQATVSKAALNTAGVTKVGSGL